MSLDTECAEEFRLSPSVALNHRLGEESRRTHRICFSTKPASLPRFCRNLNIQELGNIRGVSRVKVMEALMRSENQTETLDDCIYASVRSSGSGKLRSILFSHGASDAVSVVTFDAESSQCGSQHSR